MSEKKGGKWLLVSGGHLKPSFVEEVLRTKSYGQILVIDGALKTTDALGIRPDVVLGDFDTVDKELLLRYRAMKEIRFETHNPVKNATDTELAIEYAISRGAKELTILGALGGRMDHALANIQVMLSALQKGISCEIVDEQNRITLLNRGRIFYKEEAFGKYISFIPLTESVEGVTLAGFAYPLHNHTLVLGNSLGISNELAEEKAVLSFDSGILICVESRDL